MTDRTTKPCQGPGCDATIVRNPKMGDGRWAAVRYCGRACTGRAASVRHAARPDPTDTKVCELAGCDVVIVRKRTEGPQKWAEHEFCSPACAIAARRVPDPTETKMCALDGCEVEFRRRRGEDQTTWDKHRFCTAAHGSAARRVDRDAPRKAAPARKRAPKPPRQDPPTPAVTPVPYLPVWRPAGWSPRPQIPTRQEART